MVLVYYYVGTERGKREGGERESVGTYWEGKGGSREGIIVMCACVYTSDFI